MPSKKEFTLIKPIFIEESFTAPFYNDVMLIEIEKSIKWLKGQDNINSIILKNIEELFNELIELNKSLTSNYDFDYDNKLTTPNEYAVVNSKISVCCLETVVKSEYLTEYQNTQDVLYMIIRVLSYHKFNNQDDIIKKQQFEFIYKIILDFYSDNSLMYENIFK